MRKELTICDVCGLEIKPRKPCELSMSMNVTTAKELGLFEHYSYIRSRRGGRRRLCWVDIDVCSKECLVRLIELIKGRKEVLEAMQK